MEDYQYIIHEPATLDYTTLLSFFVDTEDMFSPKLSDRLDLKEYAKKLADIDVALFGKCQDKK